MEIKMRRHHLKYEEKIAVINAYNLGVSIKDIREKFQIGKTTLYRILKNTIVEGGE